MSVERELPIRRALGGEDPRLSASINHYFIYTPLKLGQQHEH